MGIDFSSVSHSLRSTSGGAFKLSHLHEALAAALGYKSYAAYKSSTEEAPALSSRGSAFYLLTKCHHDNSVRHGKQVRRSGHAGIVKLGRQPLIEINFNAFD